MKIPKNLAEREDFYEDVIKKCKASQEDRSRQYGNLRHFFLFGRGPDEDETPFNKIYPHIDTLTAFLFAAETTKFTIQLPPGADEHEYFRVPVLSRAVNEAWLTSNADAVFSQALTWALVYNTMIIKLIVRGSDVNPFPVDPASFAVLREDLSYTDRQEAMVHTFYTTKSQLESDLASHPDKSHILGYLSAYRRSDVQQKPSGLDRVIMSAVAPNVMGNVVTPFNANIDYVPKVAEELIEMDELWVWDDDEADYRVVTRGENAVTIYDRKNFFVDGEVPFVQICPNPMYSYYWGLSEVDRLTGLQKWRNERVRQIKDLLDKEVTPPTSVTGWMGILDEKNFALNRAGGLLATDSMQAKVDQHAPKIPENIFTVVHEIDSSFAEMSGLQNIMMGKGESGVRSGRQTSELARLGSARSKKRALTVEDSLEKMATLYLKCMRKYDTHDYLDTKGTPFIAQQFSEQFVVKVDAHSNSPLFSEDHAKMAQELLEAHAIDRESYIEMLNPPGSEMLKHKLKDIEKKEEEAKKAEQQAEAQGAHKPTVKK
jgi:hypothetical protein